MSEYVTRLNHFRFEKDDETLIVKTERDSDFQTSFELEDGEPLDDESLFDNYYLDVLTAYREYQS